MKSAVRSVIAIGYYLKCIRDERLYLEAGYVSVWDYAKARYGFSKSNAKRYMDRNDKFSVDGNSPILAEKYREYSKSQLQEMLSLDEEQMEQVTPDMTVRQIRDLRKPVQKEIPYYEIPGQLSITDFPGITQEDVQQSADVTLEPETTSRSASFVMTVSDFLPEPVAAAEPESYTVVATSQQTATEEPEPLSAYGTTKSIYPPESLIATPGCKSGTGRGFDCFACHMECEIRGEYCYCVEAAMGNPFPCEIVGTGIVDKLKEAVGSRCQFVNLDLAFIRAGDGAPVPCCKQCQTPCGFACTKSASAIATPQQVKTEPEVQTECKLPEEETSAEPVEVKDYDRKILEKMIQEEIETLTVMEDYWKENQPWTYTKHRMKIDAYQMLMDHHDKRQDPEVKKEQKDQPDLPIMKNNEQRKAFLRSFYTWPIWFEVEQAGEVYYRYDFEDGSSLVICEYSYYSEWKAKYGFSENPDTKGTREYILTPGYHYLHDCRSNETAMVEHLKKMQKG